MQPQPHQVLPNTIKKVQALIEFFNYASRLFHRLNVHHEVAMTTVHQPSILEAVQLRMRRIRSGEQLRVIVSCRLIECRTTKTTIWASDEWLVRLVKSSLRRPMNGVILGQERQLVVEVLDANREAADESEATAATQATARPVPAADLALPQSPPGHLQHLVKNASTLIDQRNALQVENQLRPRAAAHLPSAVIRQVCFCR